MREMALKIPAFFRRVTESFTNGLRKMYNWSQNCLSAPEQRSGKFLILLTSKLEGQF